MSGAQVGELRELAGSARRLADRLGDLVNVVPTARVPLSLPGGVARDSRRATEFLLRAAGALVLVDGYNVAKLGWPEEDLAGAAQPLHRPRRDRRPPAGERHHGRLRRRRRDRGARREAAHVRVSYSEPGELADDVIRREAAGSSVERPLVVVTNDQAVRRAVQAAGANLVTSEAFLQLR